ncbi:hypothetical protein ATO7_13653 [Oceanococcus atlanticus]|uniref:Uncharacterized protein n=1 Tax=Oceanococcus atlanticus TaxID=1317117 RepID=A0A1Y1SDC5_9GAMM|nr:hypothetical protein ATO7_13653 [Oceanococcus atlanticus]
MLAILTAIGREARTAAAGTQRLLANFDLHGALLQSQALSHTALRQRVGWKLEQQNPFGVTLSRFEAVDLAVMEAKSNHRLVCSAQLECVLKYW